MTGRVESWFRGALIVIGVAFLPLIFAALACAYSSFLPTEQALRYVAVMNDASGHILAVRGLTQKEAVQMAASRDCHHAVATEAAVVVISCERDSRTP